VTHDEWRSASHLLEPGDRRDVFVLELATDVAVVEQAGRW
jgi:hypothetical protein